MIVWSDHSIWKIPYLVYGVTDAITWNWIHVEI